MDDLISRQAALYAIYGICNEPVAWLIRAASEIEKLPSAQPQYEELTPEEAASEIASGSMMSARYWIDAMIRLNQMGYTICRKR